MRAKHLLSIVTIAALPGVAQAQLGGLIKKAAKSAAEGRVATATNQNVKPSDAFGPELTAASLDAVIKGLAAADAKLAEAKQLHDEKDRLYIRSSQLSQAHDGERGKYNDQVREIGNCQDSVVRVRGDAARDAYMARMKNDPAAQAEMMRASMAIQQQAASGAPNDTTRIKKLMQDLARKQGIDPAADSAVATKVCGAKPAMPAALVEEDSVKARINRLEKEVRDVENGADAAGSTASGMSRKDYALARERVVNWYAEFRSGHPVQAFGGDERKLLDARRSDIEKCQRALQ